MSKKKKPKIRLSNPPFVTFRQITVDFDHRVLVIDGGRIEVRSAYVTIPILSGDAVFIAKGDVERVA